MRKLVIVGGGSAGWITAAYLNAALNARGQKKTVDITLIESPSVPRVNVGEATIPNLLQVLNVIGIREAEFMKATDATFKQSIRFVNWENNDGSAYHHPFNIVRAEPIDTFGRDWLASKRDVPYGETVSDQPRISDMNLCPKPKQGVSFGAPVRYAYHMNAQKFADYLRDFSKERGVNHILANLEAVNVDERGYITDISLDNQDNLRADIFIDCTGFRSLLLGEALGVGFEDYSQWLLCNQAVIAQFPYEEFYPGLVRPYTTATALSAGWVWDIPMQTRRSVGYVHSSDFISEEDAEEELSQYQGCGRDAVDMRLIKFVVGQRQKAWAGNCIAIGLAGGFVEPLESTGLYLCDLVASVLAEYFPYKDEDMEPFAFRLNRIVSNRYFEILDFINMHYCLTKRTDTAFWREVQKPERINERLKQKLAFWRRKEPSALDFADQSFAGDTPTFIKAGGPGTRVPVDTGSLWHYESYRTVMYGMNYNGYDPVDIDMADRPNVSLIKYVSERVRLAPQALPLHHEWLQKALGMPDWPQGPVPAGWI